MVYEAYFFRQLKKHTSFAGGNAFSAWKGVREKTIYLNVLVSNYISFVKTLAWSAKTSWLQRFERLEKSGLVVAASSEEVRLLCS